MEQPVAAASSDLPPSFAGLLAALAAPAPKKKPAWDEEGLADDVATLSYEQALRTHARYKPAGEVDWPLAEPHNFAAPAAPSASMAEEPAHAAARTASEAFGGTPGVSLGPEESRKRASVTIRMSKAECAQLHQRAAEAGLTVSAYLRSCTFEAEALRAQVKEALAQLRAARGSEPAAARARHSWRGWFGRLFPRKVLHARAVAGAQGC